MEFNGQAQDPVASRMTQTDSAKAYYEESMKQLLEVLGHVYSRLQPLLLPKPEKVTPEKPKSGMLAPLPDWINKKADELQGLKEGIRKLLNELEI